MKIHLHHLQIVPPIMKNRARQMSGPFKSVIKNEPNSLDIFFYKMKRHYTTKENLLEVCKECAKEKGINGFGMRDVAYSSGLALGTIYNYFADK